MSKAGLADEVCSGIWIRPARHPAAIKWQLARGWRQRFRGGQRRCRIDVSRCRAGKCRTVCVSKCVMEMLERWTEARAVEMM